MTDGKLWDGFAAALLHDLGKTILDDQGVWSRHQEKVDADFIEILGDRIYKLILGHHPSREKILADTSEIALVLADRIQKAMYQIRNVQGDIVKDRDPKYQSLIHFPPFYPYYGDKIPKWNKDDASKIYGEVKSRLLEGSIPINNLKNLLDIQQCFNRYPHTSYIPHLSLDLHHRFTAILYYFIYKGLRESGRDLREFDSFSFSLIYAKPKSLELFYRLRDFKAQENIMRKLRETFFNVFFDDIRNELGINVDSNPFEFYSGDSFLIVFDDCKKVMSSLELSLKTSEELPTVDLEIGEYIVPLAWENKDTAYPQPPKWIDPAEIGPPKRIIHTIVPESFSKFSSISLGRCRRCNMPVDETVDGLCPLCGNLMKQSSGLDLESICQVEEGEERIAFVFITTPALLKHAREVAAERLIPDMEQARPKEGRSALCPTEHGLFEFLQAVMDIEDFQKHLTLENVNPVAVNPDLMVYVMGERVFWDFIPFVGEIAEKLRVSHTISGVLCHHKQPFWSIMDKLTTFAKAEEEYREGLYYDLSGGEIMTFTNEEVKAVRDLSKSGPSRSQLNILVQLARKGSLEELLLEIDIRTKDRKLTGHFAEAIKKAISRLSTFSDEQMNQNKRALFLKNIARLV